MCERSTLMEEPMSRWREARQSVLEAARNMLEKGLVVGSAGNVSMRLPPDGERPLLAITPSSRPYEELDIDDIQVVDFEAKTVEGDLAPSIETMLHAGIYEARPDVNAVIHTHSVFASAVAVAGLDIPPILDDQVVFLGGQINLARNAFTGSPGQIAAVIAALGDRSGVLLPNHGAVGTGRSIDYAFTACELIEKTARIYLLARAAGSVNVLPAETLKAEKALYDSYQRQDT